MLCKTSRRSWRRLSLVRNDATRPSGNALRDPAPRSDAPSRTSVRQLSLALLLVFGMLHLAALRKIEAMHSHDSAPQHLAPSGD